MLMMLGRLGLQGNMQGDAHDAGPFGAAGQHAGQLMLMMLGRLGLLGNMQGS